MNVHMVNLQFRAGDGRLGPARAMICLERILRHRVEARNGLRFAAINGIGDRTAILPTEVMSRSPRLRAMIAFMHKQDFFHAEVWGSDLGNFVVGLLTTMEMQALSDADYLYAVRLFITREMYPETRDKERPLCSFDMWKLVNDLSILFKEQKHSGLSFRPTLSLLWATVKSYYPDAEPPEGLVPTRTES